MRWPAGKWYVGAKNAFELFPGGLKKRMTKERRKHWDREHQAAVARTTEAIAAADNGKAGADKKDEDKAQAAQQAKLRKAELQSRLELLQGIGEKHEDAGGGSLSLIRVMHARVSGTQAERGMVAH